MGQKHDWDSNKAAAGVLSLRTNLSNNKSRSKSKFGLVGHLFVTSSVS